jgi:lipase chaperone LimK
MFKPALIIGVVSVSFVSLFYVIQDAGTPVVVNPMELGHKATPLEFQPGINTAQRSTTASQELPEKLKQTSLKGTTIDGLYPVDAQGNLLLSKDIKNRFEYFLSTMGEFELEQVLDMIKEDIALNLNSPAKEQALKLFDDYVAYKYALSDLEASLSAPQDYEVNDIERMRSQLQKMRDVRREYLDVEAVNAFFGFDEIYDDFMLASLEIKNNLQLTDTERSEQLLGLEQGLPQDVQQMRNETQRVSQVFSLTENIRKDGGTNEAIYTINEQEFGQEAAEKLQVLNQQRNQWQSRVNIFINKKQSIEKDELLNDAEKESAISDIRSSLFEQAEIRKLSAYELMAKEAESQN